MSLENDHGLAFHGPLDRLSAACLAIDTCGLIQAANPRACAMLGIDHMRRTPPSIATSLAADMVSDCFRFLRRGARAVPASSVVRHRDGRRLQLETTGGDFEGALLVTVVEIDRPGRLVAHRNGSLSHELLASLPIPFFVVAHGQICKANDRARALLGSGLVGENLADYVAASCRPSVRAWLGPRLPQQAQDLELQLLGSEGARSCQCTFTRLERDAPHSAACFVRDMTEHREFEAQLATKDRLNTVGTLASGVAHELNNPLTYVMMNLAHARTLVTASATRMEAPTHAELLDALRVAHDGAKRMTWIVEDLEGLVRGEETMGDVDVNSAIVSAIDLTRTRWRSCAVLTRQLGLLRPARANAGHITQVLVNLLLNACDAVPEHGGTIQLSTSCGREEVVIEVRDNGGGIPQEIADRIFEPFVTTKEAGDGTGLGLYVCHQYVEACGGRIEFSALPEGGTAFRVYLQLAPPGVKPAPEDRPTNTNDDLIGLELLVIDDESLIREGLSRWFASSRVTTCSSGAEAVELLESGRTFDLILCDLYMPQLSGRGVYERLVQLDSPMRRRFAIMTGGAVDPRDQAFLEEVAPPLLRKPFSSQEANAFALQVLSSFEPGGSCDAPASNDEPAAQDSQAGLKLV